MLNPMFVHPMHSCMVALLLALILANCQPEPQAESPAEAAPVLATEPAVPDPAGAPEVIPATERELGEMGLPLKMNLPEEVKPYTRSGPGLLLANEAKTFMLELSEAEVSLEELVQYWQDNPNGYIFHKFLIHTPQGLLIEAEKDGKVEYHVEYVFKADRTYRLSNTKAQPFSRRQADQMFHACRTLAKLPTEKK